MHAVYASSSILKAVDTTLKLLYISFYLYKLKNIVISDHVLPISMKWHMCPYYMPLVAQVA